MKRYGRKKRQKSSGIALPAFLCLLAAAILLIGSQTGGDDLARRLLSQLAQSERFVTGTLALETGVSPSRQAVHSPFAAAAGREEAIMEEDEAETVSESAGLTVEAAPPSTPPGAPAKAESVSVNNISGLGFDLDAMLASPKSLTLSGNGPQVLIYHTHATEAYAPSGSDTYTPSGDARTTDTSQNVVRVGTELCKVLEANGIKTVHLTDLFDYPSYNGSYGQSLAGVQAALKKYPDVQITIDLHRDAILEKDGTPRALSCEISGVKMSQLMLVMGTNASGLDFPDWKDHLNYAVNLQAELSAAYPGLMRPVNLRKQRFNLHMRPGSMLLEVGASGNTLQQSIAAVKLFGEGLAANLKTQ